MFQYIIGNVDPYSSFAIVALFVTICIPLTTAIGKRRSRHELQMQFEIDKLKLKNEDDESKRTAQARHEVELTKLALEKDIQFKRIESGLIEGVKN